MKRAMREIEAAGGRPASWKANWKASFKTHRAVLGLAIGLSVCGAPAAAQDLTHKAPPQAGPVILTNATVHPVTTQNPGEAIVDGGVVFSEGQIQFVGDAAGLKDFESRVRWAKAPTRIDAKGLHVYPGLIGANTQLGLSEIQSVRANNDTREAGSVTPEVRPAVAVNPDSTLLPVTRSNGVLTIATAASGGLIPGQVSVVQLDGWTTDEMTLRGHAGIVVNWPQMRAVETWWSRRPVEEQEREIKKALMDLERIFDTARAYAVARDADAKAPVDLRWEAMRPLFEADKSKQLPIFVAANDIDQISAAAAFCQERGLRLVIVGGRDAWLCAKLLKDLDAAVIVTTTFTMPRRADADYDEAFAVPSKLFEAGVRFCIATNDDTAHERNLPYQAAIAAAHGLAPEQALRAITISAAEVLGVSDRVGSLEPGKLATFIVTTGDPLEVRTRVTRAYIAGREIDLSNKQTKLSEKYRDRYRQKGELRGPGK